MWLGFGVNASVFFFFLCEKRYPPWVVLITEWATVIHEKLLDTVPDTISNG